MPAVSDAVQNGAVAAGSGAVGEEDDEDDED